MALAKRAPSDLDWWEEWERRFAEKPEVSGDGKFFRKGQPYAQIRTLAELPTLPFDDGDHDAPCGCADKGFRFAEEINCEI